MTRKAFLDFCRQFRRPYASMLTATAIGVCLVIGAFTGNWIPAGLAAALVPVILVDAAARTVEKINGAS